MRYAVAGSPLGPMLVARTDIGICAVAFAENGADLLMGLRDRYPEAHAEAAASTAELAGDVRAVLACLTPSPAQSALEPALKFDLPTQSPFHLRAWAAMQAIPRGQTRTYQQLAAELGSPRGQVAVGAACAGNPIAVLVPCHRVVAASGRLHGYRWGLERKRLLLALERGDTGKSLERPEIEQGRFAFGS